MEAFESTVVINGHPILWIDLAAAAWFFICWFGYTRFADVYYEQQVNLARVMDDMRSRWMQQMLRRENRVSDATLMGNILRSIYFFASTTILILIGLVTALGAQSKGLQVIEEIPIAIGSTPLMFEAKISLLAFIFIYAFFKLTWSLRQYNYACIIVGAAPPAHELRPHHVNFGVQAGKLLGAAGRNFNMGLRAYYFGMAAVSWLINGAIMILVASFVVYVVYRREFRSSAINNLVAIDEI